MSAEPVSNATLFAERLDAAWRSKQPIGPITDVIDVGDIATAYAIQTQWTRMRVGRGERIVGRKIGLTSKAIQQQLNVSEPDYGILWQSSFYEARNGKVTIPAADFLQPRIEGEVAFLIGEPLSGPGVTARQVLESVQAFALGVEVVDSRIADWKIKLVDTIADNASYGGFSLGPWDRSVAATDLGALLMTIRQNGAVAAEGPATAVMGHPANSTAWLANKLAEFGEALAPGDIVISGGITRMLPVKSGDEFVFALTGQPELTVSFR